MIGSRKPESQPSWYNYSIFIRQFQYIFPFGINIFYTYIKIGLKKEASPFRKASFNRKHSIKGKNLYTVFQFFGMPHGPADFSDGHGDQKNQI